MNKKWMPVFGLSTIGLVLVLGWNVQAAWRQDTHAVDHSVQAVSSPAVGSQTPASSVPDSPAASNPRAILNRYCVSCHNSRLSTAGLALDSLDADRISDHPDVWESVVRKLRTRAMPPAGRPRPDRATYAAVASSLEKELDAVAAADPNPGRTTAHRLNRTEYANAIRDLLGVETDVASLLPPDDADLGFDNMADILSVSPTLLERYLSAARKMSSLALGDLATPVVAHTFSIPQLRFQDDRMDEELPFGSRGGVAVKHYFPLDGEYDLRIRLRRSYQDYIRGVQRPQDIEVRVDGVRVAAFSIAGAPGTPPPWSFSGDRGFQNDREWEEYTLRGADAHMTARIAAKAGPRVVGVSFIQSRSERDGVLQPRPSGKLFSTVETFSSPSEAPEAAIDHVVITGPYNASGPGQTPSRQKILVCRPTRAADEEPCARKILSTIARGAYRRPVTIADIDALMGFYKTGRRDGGFENGIREGIQTILIDPEFLFRLERDPAGVSGTAAYRISDLELASRLSFFLWSSIPDDELLDAAASGRLRQPQVLEQQARRMFSDARAKALVTNFAGQWLSQRKLDSVAPTPELYIDWDDNLRDAFQKETELFVESQLREDRSVVDLLAADYTFVNERLARHYGIPNVYGSRFRRVVFKDGTRGGLLGQGSLLTVTSYPTRTSPVLRGHWLLENILGAPPPPPPPDVPGLPDRGEGGKTASVRERLEQHRRNPVCANCHAPMDPLGFALENFDAIGGWRSTNEAGASVDASAVSPDGTKFNGVAGLRAVLLDDREQFVATVTEKLFRYALGRGIEHYDMPAVRRVIREAAPDGYRWSSLILGIVNSTPFQMRRTES